MINIDSVTVAVQNENDLITAVGTGNIYSYIYLAVDLTLTRGITIDPSKTTLTIDGEYETVRHFITDLQSTGSGDAFGIRAASSMTLTIKNMDIRGRNYYGFPYVYDLVNTDNLTVAYENVVYTGPQMIYNCYGLTRFTDCDITIDVVGNVEAQEVGEVNRVELGGVVRVQHNSTVESRAVFYFHGSSTNSLTVLPGAVVSITSAHNYFMYNAFPFPVIQYPVQYRVMQGASLELFMNRGISYNNTHVAGSFVVEAGARFYYDQLASNTTYASLYLDGALTVNPGGIFFMKAYDNTAPLISITSAAARSITVNDPESFVLYSRGAAALAFASATPFVLSGNQINYWSAARTPWSAAGTLDDTPTHTWIKEQYALLTLNGSASATATTVTTDNLTAAERASLPALSLLHLHDARVLSIGDVPLELNPVVDDGSDITGVSATDALVRAVYTVDGVTTTIDAQATPEGDFAIETPTALPEGTPIRVYANTPFLIRYIDTAAVQAGELSVEAPALIRFVMPPISQSPAVLGREEPVLEVTVTDDRADRTTWELTVIIDGDMRTPLGYTIPDGVVYVDDGGATPLDTVVPVRVRLEDSGLEETVIRWPYDRGILLQLTAALHIGEEYIAYLTWRVAPVEDQP